MTLDGFLAGANGDLDWHFPHWNNELMDHALDQLRNTDHIVMGRVTYQRMSEHWPKAATRTLVTRDDREFAERMNLLPKTVFSKTLDRVEWQNTKIAKATVSEEIMRLKQLSGKDIVIWGGIRMLSSCFSAGLADEYRITIIPVWIGKGQTISKHTEKIVSLKLMNTRVFANGVVCITYKKNELPNDQMLLDIMTGRKRKQKVES